VSHGHLDRQFTEQVGLSPRTLARILRMRRLLEAIHVHGSVGWALKAAELGWFDQAHLIRDFKRHTGVTPSHYLAAQRSTYDSPEAALSAGFVPEARWSSSNPAGLAERTVSDDGPIRRRAMTQVFTAETTIAQPVDAVWARLTNWDLATQWMPGVDALRAHGPTAIGTNLVFTTRGKQRVGQIAAVDPGGRITLRSSQGGVTADYVYTCVQNGEGTRVTMVAKCRIAGPVRLLGPVIRAAIRRADSGQLDAFAATFTPG
jgi:carbon monoxide dehydrogenase subunit G